MVGHMSQSDEYIMIPTPTLDPKPIEEIMADFKTKRFEHMLSKNLYDRLCQIYKDMPPYEEWLEGKV